MSNEKLILQTINGPIEIAGNSKEIYRLPEPPSIVGRLEWSGSFTVSADIGPEELLDTICKCVSLMQERASIAEAAPYSNVLRLLREIKIEPPA